MKRKRIALYGGSFNPFGRHHREIVRELLKHFDLVIIVLCGWRPDKLTTNDTLAVHRAAMVDLALQGLPRGKIRIEYFDLENQTFTRNHDLQKMFEHEGELWHIVGGDLVEGGGLGNSQIQREWKYGRRLWKTLNFGVFLRSGYTITKKDLPPHSEVLHVPGSRFLSGLSSKLIRDTVRDHLPIGRMVTPEVRSYIQRFDLYTGNAVRLVYKGYLPLDHWMIIADSHNPEALATKARLEQAFPERINEVNPKLIIVFSGDGGLLQATHQVWPKRALILGANFGHIGYLHNHVKARCSPEEFLQLLSQPVEIWHSPLLYVEWTTPTGEKGDGFAFQDVGAFPPERFGYVEVSVVREEPGPEGQNVPIRKVLVPKAAGEGMLVSTIAGATGWAVAMGATPMEPYTTQGLILAGNNLKLPYHWEPAHVHAAHTLEITNLDTGNPSRRKLCVGLDGKMVAPEVVSVRVHASRYAAVDLAFLPGYSYLAKLDALRFPQMSLQN